MNLSEQIDAYEEFRVGGEPECPEPPTADDVIEAYYEAHPEEPEVEEEEPKEKQYMPKKYFEHSLREIADEMGLTKICVKNTIQSANRKMRRRMLILSLLGRKSDETICDILCDWRATTDFLGQEYR